MWRVQYFTSTLPKMEILSRLRWIIFLTSVIFNYANGSKLAGFSGKPLSCGSSVSVGVDDLFLISDVISANTQHAQRLNERQLFQSRNTIKPRMSKFGETGSPIDESERVLSEMKLKEMLSQQISSRTSSHSHEVLGEKNGIPQYTPHLRPLKKDIVIHREGEKPEEVKENGFEEHVRATFPTGTFQEQRRKYIPPPKRIPMYEVQKKTKEESETEKLLHEPGLLSALRRADFRHPIIKSFERNPKEKVPKATPKIPGYIQHMLNKINGKSTSDPSNGKAPVNKEQNAEKREKAPSADNSERTGPGSSNAQDILGSLKPETLDQLRQILNAAAGHNSKGSFNPSPGGGGNPFPGGDQYSAAGGDNSGVEDSRPEDEKSFAPRRRLKRAILWPQYPFEELAEADGIAGKQSVIGRSLMTGPRKCFWQFSRTNKKCGKLVARVMYWVDSVRDCNREYLKISGMKNTEKLCGQNNNVRSFTFEGDKLVIEHFRTSGLSTMPVKFKVTVLCE